MNMSYTIHITGVSDGFVYSCLELIAIVGDLYIFFPIVNLLILYKP